MTDDISTEEKIIALLKEGAGLRAKEISDRIGVEIKEVVSCLYGRLKGHVVQDNGYRWSLTSAGSTSSSTPGYANTTLSRLARYYMACMGQDDAGVSVFASNQYGSPDYAEIAYIPSSNTRLSAEPGVYSMLGKLRQDRSRLALYFGYPTSLALLKSRKSNWQGYMVEPILLFPARVDPQGNVEIELGYPIINQKAFRRFTNTGVEGVMEELVQLETELGLVDIDSAPDLDEIVQRLASIRPEWPWQESVDASAITPVPPLAQVNREGIFNRAVLVVTERSPFTQGLEAELTELAKLPEAGADGSALDCWLAGTFPNIENNEKPLIEVLEMNREQRDAVQHALSQPLTIITGPPGTGKSQVVTNLLINAAWHGQTVLFASKNNKAVDVVEARANSLGSRPMLLRVGSNQYQARLAQYLMGLLAATATEQDDTLYKESIALNEGLTIKRDALDSEINALVVLRNAVDEIEQQVERFRNSLGEQLFYSMKVMDIEILQKKINLFERAVNSSCQECQGAVGVLFWRFLKKSRYNTLKKVARASNTEVHTLGLKLPQDDPSDSSISQWTDLSKLLHSRIDDAVAVQRYFSKLAKLQSVRSLESITAERIALQAKIKSNAEQLWRGWLRLQPNRLSASDRSLLSKYRALLKMVIDTGTDAQLENKILRQYYSLFSRVSHLLSCWAVTSLSAKGKLPFNPNHFDLVIFDEASQCDIASALPLLYRAKRAVVIGDPKQLAHISGLVRGQDQQLLDKFGLLLDYPQWAYSYTSLFDLAYGLAKTSDIVNLRDHHRSHEDIIEFSNKTFYEGDLRVATRYSELKHPTPEDPGIRWVDVKGVVDRPESGGVINDVEARAVLKTLQQLVIERNYQGSVGVVSPFRAQANHIRQLVNDDAVLSEKLTSQNFLVDTVHKFQGDERDVIVFSPVVASGMTKGGLGFLSNNGNLFNVAITRARAQLIVVGDRQACGISGIEYLSSFARHSVELETKAPDPESISEWERILYRALCMAGIRPLPQYRVEKYALDLALLDGERKLDIEVDGERYHRNWTGELCRRDQLRNQRLFELGWDVQRFWVYEVRDDLESCIEVISQWLNK